MQSIGKEELRHLYQAIAGLRTEEECAAFFEDICTIKEIQDMAQRLEVAFLLDEGKNYLEISKETGVSSATISRVKKCLDYGSGGYRAVIEKEKKAGKKE